jgi:hypothetical protein
MKLQCSGSIHLFQLLVSRRPKIRSFLSAEERTGKAPSSSQKGKLLPTASMPYIDVKTSMARMRKCSDQKDGRISHFVQGKLTSPPLIFLSTSALIHHRWGYLPFNGGPRACLGQQFALTEIAYTTVRLLQEFQAVDSRDDSPWQENWMTSCSVLTGCQVSFIPYDDVV